MALPTSMDTSDLKETSFEPIPAGKYPVTVFKVEEVEAPGTGKMPAGTPGFNVQFRIVDGHEYQNRRFFKRYYIAPDGYEHKDMMDSMLFGFLKNVIGPEQAKSKKLNLAKLVSEEAFSGLPCTIKVTYEESINTKNDPELDDSEREYVNQVNAVLPAGKEDAAGSGGDSELLP